MKKIFLISCAILVIVNLNSFAQATQSNGQKESITFGGIVSGSLVSMMQVLDYPVIILANKDEKLLSYEMTVITPKEGPGPTFKIENNKLSQVAKNYLEAMRGKIGKIYFDNILIENKGVISKEVMVLNFE